MPETGFEMLPAAGGRTLAAQPISLLHGWVPITLQVIAVVTLLLAIGWRTGRWRLLWVPVFLVVGAAAAAVTNWYMGFAGVASHAAPATLWIWITLTALAAGVLGFGWRGARWWWRRGVSVLALALCLLCAVSAINVWTGYLPTVQSAWDQLTDGRLPGQTDEASVAAMQQRGAKPVEGTIVTVTIPDDASGFKHRDELVYLPPAWYATNPPPKLPAVMMIGGEFGTSADWLESGDAQKTIDAFAAQHGGNTPVLVFPDTAGSFTNDTECVNGVRGNAADHLTKDVVPYVISHFGVSPDPANWGVAGWSMGGTCAVTLTVKYPELFSAFVFIDGDVFPNAGDKDQTTFRLFGGDEQASAAFDPTTVMNQHGPYTGVAGLFSVSDSSLPTVHRDGTVVVGGSTQPEPEGPGTRWDDANYLCAVASTNGIECSVVAKPADHDWPSGAQQFADALPWLAGKIGTPDVPRITLPGAAAAPGQVAGR
jgi:S-formylglutathione hydrolase FrmB